MAQELADPDCLEILYFIFEHVSEDFLKDYPSLISKICMSSKAPEKGNSFTENCFLQTCSSIKVLLQLYEKLYLKSFENKSTISFELILDHIKNVLKSDPSSLSDSHLQENLQHIVASLLRIAFLHNSQDDLDEVVRFYQSNVNDISKDNELGRINITFLRLKILQTMYDALASFSDTNFHYKNVFQVKLNDLKLENSIDDCELFAKLVIYGVDEVAFQTLLFVIPQYIKCFKPTKVMKIIWEKVAKFVSSQNGDNNLSRTFLIMWHLFDFSLLEDKKSLISFTVKDIEYWDLIHIGLTKNDPLSRKQAMYLFKKTIDLLQSCDENIETFNYELNASKIWWDTNLKNEFSDIYSELIIILEFLDEQQIHIVKPMFEMIEKLIQKILHVVDSGEMFDLSWVILLYKRILMHESSQIIKWGLFELLKLPKNFFSYDFTARAVVNLLLPTLTNTSLYYNDGLTISQELVIFFEKISYLKTSKLFINLFIKKVCNLNWSAETLFFVIHAIAQFPKNSFWQEEEIIEIQRFVSKAFKTHNKSIRRGVQCELLQSVVNLTDGENVPLEKVVLLLCTFCNLESLQRGSEIWNIITKWLGSTYLINDALSCLDKYACLHQDNILSTKSLASMFFLFYDAYEKTQAVNYVTFILSRILVSFKGSDKKLYCATTSDHYLSVICHILEPAFYMMTKEATLPFETIFPYFNDIIAYILRRLTCICCLKEYDTCQLYIKVFENILKAGVFFNLNIVCHVKYLRDQILHDLGMYGNFDQGMTTIRIYLGMKFLNILVGIYGFEDVEFKNRFLNVFLIRDVNRTLRKIYQSTEQTKDYLGRIDSEYLEAKWQILERLLNDKTPAHLTDGSLNTDDIVKLCIEALNVGGYGVLSPVMSVLKNLLPKWDNDEGTRETVDSVWKIIMERRKTEEFKIFLKNFVEMLFQKELMAKGSVIENVLFEYINLIFYDPSLAVVNIFIKHIQQIGIKDCGSALLCHILAKGLIFGPIQRKDERLTIQVCSHIESSNICSVGEYNISNEVRARAVQIILTLDENCPSDRTFAENMIDALLKMENDINQNKTRYFGDSQVHRIKHRLMQALLVLEPILKLNQEKAEMLSGWLYNNLMTENSQPSVKYQQEWLLIRILVSYPSLLSKFWDYFSDTVEKKTKGLCSLIVVSYHLCKLVLLPSWIDQAIPALLPLCMDQHFEVRLYSQVVVKKLYDLARQRKLESFVERYEMVHGCVLQSIERGCKGNAGKNCIKLQEDFYLNIFHPLAHYSLETIYMDLPRLANVGADEWISTKIFNKCGLRETFRLPLKSPSDSLKVLESAKWVIQRASFAVHSEGNEDNLDETLSVNYQKKIIPSKPLVPEGFYSDNGNQNVKKDGLVVVASLIDRIPNLGGLARTCEIFGASEYVVGSLKYTEDKQFTSLSVTAEKWITVKEVKLQNLSDYLLGMKRNGYKIIGAEQALHSQPLNSVKFPKKSLLLLGNEKEGIPPNLLPLLDICVEIPQMGIIRSLNVHVSGALFIWEYAKQTYFS